MKTSALWKNEKQSPPPLNRREEVALKSVFEAEK